MLLLLGGVLRRGLSLSFPKLAKRFGNALPASKLLGNTLDAGSTHQPPEASAKIEGSGTAPNGVASNAEMPGAPSMLKYAKTRRRQNACRLRFSP
jgi:hypothetical protein